MSDLSMRQFLETVRKHRSIATDVLVQNGFHPNVVQAKAAKAFRKGYYEYGVSVTRGWVTEKGREFLERPDQ